MDVARHNQFKKGGTIESGRKGRHESSVAIRKTNKERNIKALRELASTSAGAVDQASLNQGRTEGLSERMKERLARLPEWVAGINSNDPKLIYESTTAIRKLLSIERKPPIEEVIAQGIVPRLVEFIKQDDSHELQFEAAWALTNIASGTTHQTRVVIEAGAIPIFTKLLTSANADVREQAIWALGNIAGDMVAYRNMVLDTGAMPLLLQQLSIPLPVPNDKLLSDKMLSVVRNGTWTLSNFCRGKPAPALEVVQPALQVLAHLIKMTDDDVIVDACWALSYISDGTPEKITAIISAGVCPRLVELLGHKNESIQTPALRAIGNIVTGSDVQTQVVISLNVLRYLLMLLGSKKDSIVKEACWTISNITAGSPEQIQAVIDNGLFPALIVLLRHQNFDVKKEAAWAISNATSLGRPVQIDYLIDRGIIKPFCDLLDERDPSLVMVALDCLDNVLRFGEEVSRQLGTENKCALLVEEAAGIDKIEALTASKLPELCQKANKLVDDYFLEDDEQEWNQPNNMNQMPNNMQGFNGAPPGGFGGQAPGGFQFNF